MNSWDPYSPASFGRAPSSKLGSVCARAGVSGNCGSTEWRSQAMRAVQNAGLGWGEQDDLLDEIDRLCNY